jgi:hypothetical protein
MNQNDPRKRREHPDSSGYRDAHEPQRRPDIAATPVGGDSPMHEYDKSGTWLIQHHGNSILRLGRIRKIQSWKPLQAEIVEYAATCRTPNSFQKHLSP